MRHGIKLIAKHIRNLSVLAVIVGLAFPVSAASHREVPMTQQPSVDANADIPATQAGPMSPGAAAALPDALVTRMRTFPVKGHANEFLIIRLHVHTVPSGADADPLLQRVAKRTPVIQVPQHDAALNGPGSSAIQMQRPASGISRNVAPPVRSVDASGSDTSRGIVILTTNMRAQLD